MASSSGKPGAVHFSLIFFVMTTIIAVAVAWVQTNQYTETAAKLKEANDEKGKLTDANRNYQESIEAVGKRLGYQYNEVGVGEEENATTILGAVRKDMIDFGGVAAAEADKLPTVHDLLINLRQEIDKLQSDFNTKVVETKGSDDRFKDLNAAYTRREDEAKALAKTEDTRRAEMEASQKERLEAADKRYEDKVAELAAERADHEKTKADAEKQIAALSTERKNLITINDRFKAKIDNIEKKSFEVEDGQLRWVDHGSRLVWINVGSDDNLAKRTTFSVYEKGHSGIGRGAEDIKGAIEVTRIIGPHLAEARIVDDNPYEPMAPGDPVYTPLWSPGRTETFAIVGFIDVDGDGKSDRDLLREFIQAAGGRFEIEIDDAGNRAPEDKFISVSTKFMVVGELPDPSTTADEDEKKTFTRILGEFKTMQDNARQQGVRQINLGDFLAYIGYRPSRRLWRPGEESPYKLKSGAQSTATNESVQNRESSGQTSRLYSRSRRNKGPVGNSRVKQRFRGGATYDR